MDNAAKALLPVSPATIDPGIPGLAIVVAPGPEASSLAIRVTANGRQVAEAEFRMAEGAKGWFDDIWVDPSWRRKGIATAVYDAVESLGVEVVPSSTLDEDGALFWEARTLRRAVTPR